MFLLPIFIFFIRKKLCLEKFFKCLFRHGTMQVDHLLTVTFKISFFEKVVSFKLRGRGGEIGERTKT